LAAWQETFIYYLVYLTTFLSVASIRIMDAIRKLLLDLTHARAWPAPFKQEVRQATWGKIAGNGWKLTKLSYSISYKNKNKCVLEAKKCATPHRNLKALRASITWEELSKDYIVKKCWDFRPRIEAVLPANGKHIE
jgi:hypothetical protein